MNQAWSLPSLYFMHHTLLRVALPVPLYRLFDYLCPSKYLTDGNLPPIGARVRVPFGHQELVGIVIKHVNQLDSGTPTHKLKAVHQCLDDQAVIDDVLLDLANWLATYYHHPLGDTLSVMLPSLINQGKSFSNKCKFWQLAHAATNENFVSKNISKTAKKQWQVFNIIKNNPPSMSESELLRLGATKLQLNTLQHKGLIHSSLHKPHDLPTPKLPTLIDEPLTLNTEQQSVFNDIRSAIDGGVYQGILLNGITGSGKTEVYLHAMWHTLKLGKQVLILVPEIGLAPQTKDRFSSRFDAQICVLHSGMNDDERLQGWQDCRTGQAQIIIGTRSSILYPFSNLGLIVVDEAHDSSYKQQDHLRYHAVAVALWRGFYHNIPTILGTATPSLEQLKLAKDGKLKECQLTARAGNANQSAMNLVDVRLNKRTIIQTDGTPQETSLSNESVLHIRRNLELGGQVLIFLNRRGYAPILLCDACGWQADCPRCDAHLNVHKYPIKYLRCHHCGYQTPKPQSCPTCNSHNVQTLGLGTSKLSEQLHTLFSNPQTNHHPHPIWQIDRDTMNKKGAWEAMYQRILTGEPAILVGTQMIAKGHHFPNVTLVVVVDADLGFLSPDFRSPEHTAQRIIQVAGRAGRAQKMGKVIIQTRQPDNPLLLTLVKHGYLALSDILLKERQLLGLPPYTHAALIRAESHNQTRVRDAISQVARELPDMPNLTKSGALDAPMNKKNNRYHTQLLLLSKDRKTLHDALSANWERLLHLPDVKGVKVTLDIDPIGWQ